MVIKKALILILFSSLILCGCADTTSHTRGVYMLLDTSGTYTKELKRAEAIISYLLGTLQPGDTLAVARIDSGSFSEKDIVAKMTFDKRPSVANQQKRLFKQKVDKFVTTARGSAYTDITGGVLQSVEYLTESGAGKKYILIFSDLKEDLAKGHVRNFPIQVDECNVVALNVTKLRTDNMDPREYYKRVEAWRARVEAGGGNWRVVNDLERLENILGG
ncbi:MAG: VWA domain-containing protein [Deltaproteobacteria bacterium]|nr:MAG: VWA domain-containing protein [Deltaproteobacteria bacterium]